jgi:sugar lactone lactonase YvrE
MKQYWILAVLLFWSFLSSSQIITTIAGNGLTDGYPATATRLMGPSGVVVDKFGNIYITEIYGNKIRKVDATSGIISTYAGNGTAGYGGDNGPANLAKLNYPYGLFIDTSGDLYIADAENNRIRKVSSSGIITTVAGIGIPGNTGDNGLAINASIRGPSEIAIDCFGNLFFSQSSAHTIRKIDLNNGIITTVAGSYVTPGYNGDSVLANTALIRNPVGIATDKIGNIYFVDRGNNRVRKINNGTGIITTIVGTDSCGFSGDSSLGASAMLCQPHGLAIDTIGNLYISDVGNERIRKLDILTDYMTTIAGNGNAGYSGDNGPAISASIYYPYGETIDQCGNLYFAEISNNRIRKVWFNTDTIPQVNIAVTPNDTVITGTQVTTTASVPTGTIINYQWVKNGANASTNSVYTYTPVNGDSVNCIVTVRACTGRMYTDTTTAIHITVTGGAGVASTTNSTLQTYPNPVTVVLHVTTTEPQHYVLHNLMGVTLLQGSVDKQNSIDMKAIPSGTYLLQLTNNEGQREVLRVVKE